MLAIEAIFPEHYKGRAKKSIQFTYGAFALEADGSFKFKFIKEKLLVSNISATINTILPIVQQDHIRAERYFRKRQYSSQSHR